MSTQSHYLLVEWSGERRYSVLKRDQLCDSTLRECDDETLIGQETLIFWQKKTYNARVLQCGGKLDMQYEMNILISQEKDAGNKKSKKKKASEALHKQVQGVLNVLNEHNNDHPESSISFLKQELAETKEQLRLEREKCKKYQEEAVSCKRKLDQLEIPQNEIVDIGQGVLLPKTQLDTINAISHDAGSLARNLLRALYQESELLGFSLFGRTCNANKSNTRPSIEPIRRDAIIMYVVSKYGAQFSQSAGMRDKGKNLLLKMLHQTMGDHLSFIRRKTKLAHC